MWYFILYIAVGIWVFIDSKKRLFTQGKIYSIATVILGPLTVPVYLAMRPLKKDESREGGTAWTILKNFALFWTLTMVGFGMFAVSDVAKAGGNKVLVFGMVFVIWFVPMVGAVILGFFLKKSSAIENGPTGPLVDHEEGDYDLKKFTEQAKDSVRKGIDKVKGEIDKHKNTK